MLIQLFFCKFISEIAVDFQTAVIANHGPQCSMRLVGKHGYTKDLDGVGFHPISPTAQEGDIWSSFMKKIPPNKLAEQYLTALKTYFDQGQQASLLAARDLGRVAVATGLETLDLAKVHDKALASLIGKVASQTRRDDLNRRGATFFTEAIVAIEATHPGAIKQSADVAQLKANLDQRQVDLANSQSEVKQQITVRQEAEATLGDSERTSGQLLEDSRILERDLKDMAQKILSATEGERKKMSLHLNDEIAQTLLGINIRLLAVKKMIDANDKSLTLEITTIQLLLEESVTIINRLANEFSSRHA